MFDLTSNLGFPAIPKRLRKFDLDGVTLSASTLRCLVRNVGSVLVVYGYVCLVSDINVWLYLV